MRALSWAAACLFGALCYLAVYVALAHGQARDEVRIDTFDRNYNRDGYVIVNPKTGRTDTFDKFSNRKNSAVITPPPTQWAPGGRALVTPQPTLRRSK